MHTNALQALSPDMQRLLSRGYYAHVVNEHGGRDLVFVIQANRLHEELERPAAETAVLLDEHASRLEPYREDEGFDADESDDDDGEIDL
jgi:hypothetical protein